MKEILVRVRDKPVFICGHPKSGTSLVRALLDSHPQLLVYPEETVFFRSYLPRLNGLNLADKIALAETNLLHIFTWNQAQPPPSQKGFPDRDYSDVSFEQVRQAYNQLLSEEGGFRHDGDLLSAAVLAFGQVTGHLTEKTLRWVEKSPYNERYVKRILDWWPQARFIHVVRDPRDNHLSYRRKHPDWSAETFTLNWVNSTRIGVEHQKRLGEEIYRVICYEHLVREPEQVLSALRDFLSIEDHPTLAVPTRNHVPWGGNSMFDLEFEGISTASVGRWKQKLKVADAGIIQILARPYLEHLGYELTPGLPFSVLLRLVKWNLYRLLRGIPAMDQDGFL